MFTKAEALALDRVPGGLKSETLLAQAWISQTLNEYLFFDFNVAVGDGRDPGDHIPAALRNAAIEASKRRIDIVAYDPYGRVDLGEVKGRADAMALGQLDLYKQLWESKQIHPVNERFIVCCLIDPELLTAANSRAFGVFVFPDLVDAIRRT